MSRTTNRKRRPASGIARDIFAGRGKGVLMEIRVDADLLHMLDAYRSDVEQMTGVKLERARVLEGLVRKVWREKLMEAAVLGAGSKLTSDDEKGGDE